MKVKVVEKEYTKKDATETLEHQFNTMSNMFFKAENEDFKRMLYLAFIAGCSAITMKDYIESKYPEMKDEVTLKKILDRLEEDM
jgi:hypothetical protein